MSVTVPLTVELLRDSMAAVMAVGAAGFADSAVGGAAGVPLLAGATGAATRDSGAHAQALVTMTTAKIPRVLSNDVDRDMVFA